MFRTNLNLDPIAEMQQWIQFMDQAYNKAAGTQTQQTIIPIDLYEYDNELFVRAAIPGVHPENVNVTVNTKALTVTGITANGKVTASCEGLFVSFAEGVLKLADRGK